MSISEPVTVVACHAGRDLSAGGPDGSVLEVGSRDRPDPVVRTRRSVGNPAFGWESGGCQGRALVAEDRGGQTGAEEYPRCAFVGRIRWTPSSGCLRRVRNCSVGSLRCRRISRCPSRGAVSRRRSPSARTAGGDSLIPTAPRIPFRTVLWTRIRVLVRCVILVRAARCRDSARVSRCEFGKIIA